MNENTTVTPPPANRIDEGFGVLNVRVVQPPYPQPGSEADSYDAIVKALENCEPAVDLLVLPEYANAPGVGDPAELRRCIAERNEHLIRLCANLCRRSDCMVCINLALENDGAVRNVTLLFDRDGSPVSGYEKLHLTGAETDGLGLDHGYAADTVSPAVCTVDGIRFGFLTCYDIYFDEFITAMKPLRPDVVLFPSYQRHESEAVITQQCSHAAHQLNCFVVRASYAMGLESLTGANTLIAAPDGTILHNLGQQPGNLDLAIRPQLKRCLPDNAGLRWFDYRSPRAYLPAGPAVSLGEKATPYPRLCAHRGLNTVAPENTLPAFGAAVALGAAEIEFDVRLTGDGEPVVCHDPTLNRTTDRTGRILELPLSAVLKADAGVKFSPRFAGTRIPTLQQVLRRFAGLVVMNVHVNFDCESQDAFDAAMEKLCAAVYQYGCAPYVYLAGDRRVLEAARRIAPELARACLYEQIDDAHDGMALVEHAIEYGCTKLQFFKPNLSAAAIAKAKEHGIRCNVFWADDPAEAADYLRQGIDTVLTNDCLALAGTVRA